MCSAAAAPPWLGYSPTLQVLVPLSNDIQYPKIPVCRVYNDQIILYEVFDGRCPRSEKQIENEKNLTRGEFNGFMSPKTKAKVKKYLNTWVDAVMQIRKSIESRKLDQVPYLTFVTLTLPCRQIHDDNLIKRKCLTPFIQEIQKYCGVRHYFWRAEAQKNGNIHFHLIVDSKIPWRDLRDRWNRCVEKLNYVSDFERIHGHRDPNSTDIHSLKGVNSPASYVIKYCCKSDGYRKIDGRIHGCSDGLKNLQPYEDLISGDVADFVEKAMNDPETKVIQTEEFTIIRGSVRKLAAKYHQKLLSRLIRYRIEQAISLYSPEPPPDSFKISEKFERKKLIQMELFDVCY